MNINELIGKTLTEAIGSKGDDEIIFKTTEGRIFKLYHSQDCCEHVSVDDICGEMNDLVGSPITQAEESSNDPDPVTDRCLFESYTWTFYRISTMKGQVVIKWLGESNGYYSERVDFMEITT